MSEELVKRIAELERELAELKQQVKPVEDVPKPTKPWPKYDPTEGFRLPPSAAKAMASVVPDPKPTPGFNAHSWSQNKGPGEPGGFGPPPKPNRVPEVKRGSGVVEPRPLEPPPGLKYIDQQIDVQDALDRRELERRLGGK
jgi:hypothetical protein